jgi:RimJ/RimL family protein N-acetyltransferase
MTASRVHKVCTAADGRPYLIREADVTDAAQLLDHARDILREPQWSVTEPHEFRMTAEEEENWIRDFRRKPHSIMLVADVGGPGRPEIVGAVSFTTQSRFRMRHRGRLGIGVQAAYRGVGIGEALLRALLEWAAAEPELERVELSVFAHNTRAINLYRKLGFTEEGRTLRAFKLADGSYYDDIQMVCRVK